MSSIQYLVVGANRGLGLEFVRQLLKSPRNTVVATYRDPSKIDELKKLSVEKANAGRLELVRLDMCADASCKAAVDEVRSKVGALDVLIVNAAAVANRDNALLEQNIQDLASVFENNALGPLRITQLFVPLLKPGSSSLNNSTQPKVIFITSGMGSLTGGKNSWVPSYSTSKAALNMIGRKLSYELEPSKVAVGLVDPGWVQTDMGGPNASLTPSESVSGMLKVIDQIGMQNTGEYWQWDGQSVPW